MQLEKLSKISIVRTGCRQHSEARRPAARAAWILPSTAVDSKKPVLLALQGDDVDCSAYRVPRCFSCVAADAPRAARR